jgi:hypothetical protein
MEFRRALRHLIGAMLADEHEPVDALPKPTSFARCAVFYYGRHRE